MMAVKIFRIPLYRASFQFRDSRHIVFVVDAVPK